METFTIGQLAKKAVLSYLNCNDFQYCRNIKRFLELSVYNTPQNLDRALRCMLACHNHEGGMTKCEAYGKIMIQRWRKQLLAELPAIFSDKKKRYEKAAEELEAELYRQIGQLKAELEWSTAHDIMVKKKRIYN